MRPGGCTHQNTFEYWRDVSLEVLSASYLRKSMRNLRLGPE